MRCHYIGTGMAKIKTDNCKVLVRVWSNCNSHALLVGMQFGK